MEVEVKMEKDACYTLFAHVIAEGRRSTCLFDYRLLFSNLLPAVTLFLPLYFGRVLAALYCSTSPRCTISRPRSTSRSACRHDHAASMQAGEPRTQRVAQGSDVLAPIITGLTASARQGDDRMNGTLRRLDTISLAKLKSAL